MAFMQPRVRGGFGAEAEAQVNLHLVAFQPIAHIDQAQADRVIAAVNQMKAAKAAQEARNAGAPIGSADGNVPGFYSQGFVGPMQPQQGVPTWAWVAGAGILAAVAAMVARRKGVI